MRKFIIKRLLLSIVILFFVAFIIYTLMRCLPTSYIEAMARQKSMQPGSKSFEEWMQQLTATYNMDKGIIPGFFAWIGSMFRGDFGDSWRWTVPVIEKFNDTVWLSFIMGLISFIFEQSLFCVLIKSKTEPSNLESFSINDVFELLDGISIVYLSFIFNLSINKDKLIGFIT